MELSNFRRFTIMVTLTAFSILYSLKHTNSAFAFGFSDFFNPSSYTKIGWKMASDSWEFSKDMIGKDIQPFKLGEDSFGRAMSISYQLKRSMMINDFDMMDVMMLYGFESYEAAANVMPGSLEDDVLEEMLKTVLSNKTVTKYFLKDALKSKAAAKLVEKLADKDQDIVEKLGVLMAEDEDIAQLSLRLAIKHPSIARILLRRIDDDIYSSLITAMYKSRKTTVLATEFLEKYAKEAFDKEHYNFTKVFYNLGNPDDTNDANEIELERMLYVITKDNEAAKNYLRTCNKLTPQQKFEIRNFVVNGTSPDGVEHTHQIYYNIYAMIKGFNRGDALEEVPTGQIAFLNPDALERCPNLLPRFMTTLITGALLYHDKDCIEMNEKMMKLLPYFMQDERLAKMINDVMKNLNPDPTIPPPEHFTDLNVEVLKYSGDKVYIETSFDIEPVFFERDFKDEKLYTKGEQDKWLLLPHWLSPSVWYRTENSPEMRNVPQSKEVATIDFTDKEEYIVFLIASPNSPYLLWALREGFVPLEDVYVETKYQTGLIVFAKLIEEGTAQQVLYGNGGGEFNYVFGIVKKTAHPYYKYAKHKYKLAKSKFDLNAINQNEEILKKYTFNSKIYENHYYSAKVKAYDGMNYLMLKKENEVIAFDKNKGYQIKNFHTLNINNNLKLPTSDERLNDIAYGNGAYVVVGNNGTVFISKDGKNWEQIDVDTGKDLYSVSYGKDKFVAGGEDGRIVVIHLDKKVDILDRDDTHTKGYDIFDVEYVDNHFVVVGEKGIIATSPSNLYDEWSVDYISVEENKEITINRYIELNGRKIIFTNDGRVIVYSDLKQNWVEKMKSGRLNPITDVAYGDGYYVAVGRYGAIFISKNGKIWEDAFVDNWISFDKVAYLNGEFLGITRNGLVVKINPNSRKTLNWSNNINTNYTSNSSSKGGGCSLGNSNNLTPLLFYLIIPFLILIRKRSVF